MRYDVAPETVQTQVERTTAGSPLARWILAVAVFLIPLSFLPNTVDEFVLPKLLLARLLVIVLTVVLVAGWLRQGAVTWKRTALDLPLLAFIGSAAISSIFAVNGNVAIFGVYDRWEGLLTITTYALLFWLAVQLMSGERDARWMTWSLLSSGYLIAGVAVLQSTLGVLGGGYFLQSGTTIRADSTMAHPDFLGIFLAMLLPVAFAKLISRRPLMTRLLAANLVIVLSLGLLFTYTRSAWIGAVVGLAVVLALRGGRFRPLPLIAFAAVLVIGFAALAGIVAARPASAQGGVAYALYSRVVSLTDFSSGSIAERLAVWKDTPAIIAARPVLGYGPDNFALVYPLFQTLKPQCSPLHRPSRGGAWCAGDAGRRGVPRLPVDPGGVRACVLGRPPPARRGRSVRRLGRLSGVDAGRFLLHPDRGALLALRRGGCRDLGAQPQTGPSGGVSSPRRDSDVGGRLACPGGAGHPGRRLAVPGRCRLLLFAGRSNAR